MRYFFILLVFLLQLSIHAQVSTENKSLASAVMAFNQLGKSSAYQDVFQEFEQLYRIDKTNWLIPYYASIIQSRMCLIKIGDRDQHANEALQWVAIAKSIAINDEIYCAESLANTAKMSVNPTLRWLTYEEKIKKPLQLAKKMNPSNPRVYLLEANIQQKLPALFGGGCKATKPLIQKAEQFLNQHLATTLYPAWGRQSLIELKKACPF